MKAGTCTREVGLHFTGAIRSSVADDIMQYWCHQNRTVSFSITGLFSGDYCKFVRLLPRQKAPLHENLWDW